MHGLIGSFKTHAGKRDELAAYLLRAADLLRALEGCYLYVIANATDDPDTLWFTEVWRSKEAHQASLTHEGVRAIIAVARPLIAGASGFETVPLGGKGLSEPTD
jgi:quinol monooxygenase YgiN